MFSAAPWSLDYLQKIMKYQFHSVSLLNHALIAGDSNSEHSEGHRGLAQLGDSIIGTVLLSEGLRRGRSRKELQDACSCVRSKEFCGVLAKRLLLHELVKLSDRQVHIGAQPTTLKNVLAALVGAAWLDSQDYSVVLKVMLSLGLLADIPWIQQNTWADCADSIETDDSIYTELTTVMDFVGSSHSQDHSPISAQDTIRSTPPSSPSDTHHALQIINLEDVHSPSREPPKAPSPGRATRQRNARHKKALGDIIGPYLDCERAKTPTIEQCAQVMSRLQIYEAAIYRAPKAAQRPLAVITISIGDCSAISQLKEAIRGLRASNAHDFRTVDTDMSVEDRINVIHNLEAGSAYLRLLRLLHIVTLWEQTSRTTQKTFTFTKPLTTIDQEPSPLYGSRKNLLQSEIAQSMQTQQEPQDRRISISSKRLRHIGQRLGTVVQRWGYGALLLLGPRVNDEKLMRPTENSFNALVNLLDELEGDRISAISAAALPIVQALRANSSSFSTIALESTDEDRIATLTRLSIDFEDLLQASNGKEFSAQQGLCPNLTQSIHA